MKNKEHHMIVSLYFLPFISILLLGAGTLMYSPLVIPYTTFLGGDEVHGTYIEGLSKFIACLGVVFVGHHSTMWGRKKTLVYIFITGSVGNFVAAAALNPLMLLVASTISSLSFASMSAVMMTYLADIAPKDRQGAALGVFGTAIGCSAALGAIGSTIVAEQYGFRIPFAIAAVLIAIGAVIVHTWFVDKGTSSVIINTTYRGTKGLKLLPQLPKLQAMGVILYLAAFSYQFSQSSLSTLLTPLVAYLNEPLRMAGLSIGAYGIFGLMQPLGGKFGDCFGRKTALLLGSFLFFFGLLLISMAQSALLLLIGSAIFGIGTALFMPSICVAVYNSVPQEMRGITMGLFQSILTIGAVLGPVGGGIALHFGTPRHPFILNGVVVGIALILLVATSLPRLRRESVYRK